MSDGEDEYKGDERGPGRRPGRDPGKQGALDGQTYLYIRDHPFDTGAEPLTPELEWWISPDIVVVQPDGTRGGEAVAGAENTVEVTITNAGGGDAVGASVEAFLGDPAIIVTPASAIRVGRGRLTVPGHSSATIAFRWVFDVADAGHRCLVARVGLSPSDTYLNGTMFDVPNDRHVAQRNVTVLAVAGLKAM